MSSELVVMEDENIQSNIEQEKAPSTKEINIPEIESVQSFREKVN